jgi:hypothetical protein
VAASFEYVSDLEQVGGGTHDHVVIIVQLPTFDRSPDGTERHTRLGGQT